MLNQAAAFGAGFSTGVSRAPVQKQVLRLVDGSFAVCETAYDQIPRDGWTRSDIRGCWFRAVAAIDYRGNSILDAEHAARAAGLL